MKTTGLSDWAENNNRHRREATILQQRLEQREIVAVKNECKYTPQDRMREELSSLQPALHKTRPIDIPSWTLRYFHVPPTT